jgi:multidrug resistance efflux pump
MVMRASCSRFQGAVKASVAEFDRNYRNYRNYQDKKITSVAEVEEAKANLKAAEAALNASRAKLQRYQPIATEGAIAKEQFEEAKLAVEQH